MTQAPEKIYLRKTWHSARQFNTDVEYVRMDIHDAATTALTKELDHIKKVFKEETGRDYISKSCVDMYVSGEIVRLYGNTFVTREEFDAAIKQFRKEGE